MDGLELGAIGELVGHSQLEAHFYLPGSEGAAPKNGIPTHATPVARTFSGSVTTKSK